MSKDKDVDIETAPIMRRLFVNVTQSEFSAFLRKGTEDGRVIQSKDGNHAMVDIDGILHEMVRAYNEGRVVILTAHELSEMKKAAAKKHASTGADLTAGGSK